MTPPTDIMIREALGRVATKLEDGTIEPDNFDMCEPCSKDPLCGTVACIGGWTGLELGMTARESRFFVLSYEHRMHPLSALFYPTGIDPTDWQLISPRQAAVAIRNFLSYSDSQWDTIL